MLRVCIAALGLYLALALSGGARASAGEDVWLSSLTSTVTSRMLRNDLPAFQRSAGEFRRWWGGPQVTLHVGVGPLGAMRVTVAGWTGPFGIGGYHGLGPGAVPYAIAYPYQDWTILVDHELLEMLADPYLVRTIQGDLLYLVEVCDPVETWGYTLPGADGKPVWVSDFVGPDWYTGGRYFDFRHQVASAHQLLPGGFVSYWNGSDWLQIYGPFAP